MKQAEDTGAPSPTSGPPPHRLPASSPTNRLCWALRVRHTDTLLPQGLCPCFLPGLLGPRCSRGSVPRFPHRTSQEPPLSSGHCPKVSATSVSRHSLLPHPPHTVPQVDVSERAQGRSLICARTASLFSTRMLGEGIPRISSPALPLQRLERCPRTTVPGKHLGMRTRSFGAWQHSQEMCHRGSRQSARQPPARPHDGSGPTCLENLPLGSGQEGSLTLAANPRGSPR